MVSTLSVNKNSDESLKEYLSVYKSLAQTRQWEKILTLGTLALKASKATKDAASEAKITAELASAYYSLENFEMFNTFSRRVHEISENFIDQKPFIKVLYLESAFFRAIAGKLETHHEKKEYFQKAVQSANEALKVYSSHKINRPNLKGKIFYNLGSAHADNPYGSLDEAINCYKIALDCFQSPKAEEAYLKTQIKLANSYLLQEKYDLSIKIIKTSKTVNSTIKNFDEQLLLQIELIEAEIELALENFDNALKLSESTLNRLRRLKNKDESEKAIALNEKIKLQKERATHIDFIMKVKGINKEEAAAEYDRPT